MLQPAVCGCCTFASFQDYFHCILKKYYQVKLFFLGSFFEVSPTSTCIHTWALSVATPPPVPQKTDGNPSTKIYQPGLIGSLIEALESTEDVVVFHNVRDSPKIRTCPLKNRKVDKTFAFPFETKPLFKGHSVRFPGTWLVGQTPFTGPR